jgi:hypothetical protein
MSYLEDKLYSKAFNDGFEYAIEKLFAEEDEEKKPKKWPYAVGGAIAGTVGGSLTFSGVTKHLMKKDLDLNAEELKKLDRLPKSNPKAYEKIMENYYEGWPKSRNKAVGAGLGAMGALGVAVPMALYHHRKNKLNKKERD